MLAQNICFDFLASKLEKNVRWSWVSKMNRRDKNVREVFRILFCEDALNQEQCPVLLLDVLANQKFSAQRMSGYRLGWKRSEELSSG